MKIDFLGLHWISSLFVKGAVILAAQNQDKLTLILILQAI